MTRRLAALAALLLAPSLALAQSTPSAGQVTVTHAAKPSQATPIINIAQCEGTTVSDRFTYFWNVASATSGTYELYIADQPSVEGECPRVGGTNLTVNSRLVRTVSVGTNPQRLVDDTATVAQRLASVSIPCDGSKTTLYLCVNYTPSGGTKQQNAASGSVELDLTIPPVPTEVAVQPGDSSLHVSWKQGSGTGTTNGYRIFWRQDVDGAAESSGQVTGAGTLSFSIGSLQNGLPYLVQVAALSKGENESERSAPVAVTPVTVEDFWRLYKSDGGHEQGGCAAGGGGLAALLWLLPLALRRRGRRP